MKLESTSRCTYSRSSTVDSGVCPIHILSCRAGTPRAACRVANECRMDLMSLVSSNPAWPRARYSALRNVVTPMIGLVQGIEYTEASGALPATARIHRGSIADGLFPHLHDVPVSARLHHVPAHKPLGRREPTFPTATGLGALNIIDSPSPSFNKKVKRFRLNRGGA